MATVIPASVAEALVTEITGQDVELRFHTGDPSTTGANEVTGLNPVTVLDTDWAAFVNDTATLAQGGRVATNTAEIDLGTATADETVTYVTVWKETTPASGTFDIWIMTIALTAPGVSYVTSNPVVIAAGDLEIFGAGAA